MVDAYLISLCQDYITMVDTIMQGAIDDFLEAEKQRLVIHRQLCEYTGMDPSEDMYRYCRNVLHAARGGNIQ